MSESLLSNAFAEGSIAIGSVITPESALRVAGGLLEISGRTDGPYTDAMVAALHEFGPYFVVAPGIAIAHARPSESVYSMGLSLLVLNEPIEFGNEANDPVRLVFGLCAPDHDGHLGVMAELSNLLMDADRVNSLLNAVTVEDIRSILA
jgi:PTS system ascorbate-specific IIA component